ncbi:MAG: hypothetical protein ACLR02_11200 [Clostridium sp.]
MAKFKIHLKETKVYEHVFEVESDLDIDAIEELASNIEKDSIDYKEFDKRIFANESVNVTWWEEDKTGETDELTTEVEEM